MQKQQRIISLDIDESSVVATALAEKKGHIYLDRYAVASNLKELAADLFFRKAQVVIHLSTQTVLFRSFHLSPGFFKGKNMKRDILEFLVRQNLPLRLEDCYWSTFTTDSNLNLVAAKKEAVDKTIQRVEEAGFSVSGVTVPLIALYNVLIYTYPERLKDRFALLNIKTAASDLVIYEARRLWVYPLSIGSKDLQESLDALEKFSSEVQRTFNSHYLQNPPASSGAPNYFYVTGKGSLEPLVPVLKKILVDFEITTLATLKTIESLTKSKDYPINMQAMSLALGLGLTYLDIPFGLKINLLEENIRRSKQAAALNILKAVFFFGASFTAIFLLMFDIRLMQRLSAETASLSKSGEQASSVLPQTKALMEEKEKLAKLEKFLIGRLDQQELVLRALAVVSESKPADVTIREFDADSRVNMLEAVISGSAADYEKINLFLNELKKREGVLGVKVVASTVAAEMIPEKNIDFKLRFEIPFAK